jgi:hypothetical protein
MDRDEDCLAHFDSATDGLQSLTTDFPFVMWNGLVSSIVLNCDWLAVCRDAASHDRRSIPSSELADEGDWFCRCVLMLI